MITINSLRISPKGDILTAELETIFGRRISKATFWTRDTFKDISQGIDLSEHLTGIDHEEVIEICPSDVGLTSFDSIYFLEFEDTDEKLVCTETLNPQGDSLDGCITSNCAGDPVEEIEDCCPVDPWVELGVTANFSKYHACLLDKLMSIQINGCEITDQSECGGNSPFISALIQGLYLAVQHGFYEESFKILDQLDELCCSNCQNCDSYPDTYLVNGAGFGTFSNSVTLI